MSLKTWKAEFYPITATQAATRGDLAAAEHSLKKWEGALADGLEEEINELVRQAVERRRKHDPATYVRPKVAELTERVSDAILAKATFCGIPVTSLSAAEAHRVICHVWLQP